MKQETKKITVHINKEIYDRLRLLHGQQKIESITQVVNLALVKYLMSMKHDEEKS